MPSLFSLESLLSLCGVVALIVAAWGVRGWWDRRQATIVPRMADATLAMIAELNRLQQNDPATVAAQAIEKATVEAKNSALKDAVAKLP